MSITTTPRFGAALRLAGPVRVGRVRSAVGLGIEVEGLDLAIGDLVELGDGDGTATVAEVTASRPGTSSCMALEAYSAPAPGAPVRRLEHAASAPVGPGLLGRVVDGLGRPIDGKGPLVGVERVDLANVSPAPMTRARIDTPLHTGVRVLDGLVPLGRGQRIGLFAGSGVGKSSLLSMIARGTDAAMSVIALVGERGREVREFLDDDLGPEGLARSVVVVATADEPAPMRLRAALLATRIAEEARERGEHVVLMMDSLTRVAMAQREVGLSAGEPPATRGYPPSTFSLLARLLERAGTAGTGSITGVYTVLVEGDDHNEPIADTARSILDGHVVLVRRLAVAGHFPSVDVLDSVSRVAPKVTAPSTMADAAAVRRALAARRHAQDLIDVGAYQAGANPLVDAAIANEGAIDAFLRQRMDERTNPGDAARILAELARAVGGER